MTSALAQGSTVGEYLLVCQLGAGADGPLYGAIHPLIGKRAAVRVLEVRDEAAIVRFTATMSALHRLDQPGIVDVFGFGGLPDGRSYLAMDWLDGESLPARLARPLALDEALAALEPVAEALAAAHAAGLGHGALRPSSVFLAAHPGRRVRGKLLDFGHGALAGRGVDESRAADVAAFADLLERVAAAAPLPATLGGLVASARAGTPPTMAELHAALAALARPPLLPSSLPPRRRPSPSTRPRGARALGLVAGGGIAFGGLVGWHVMRPDAGAHGGGVASVAHALPCARAPRPTASPAASATAPQGTASLRVTVDAPDARLVLDGRLIAQAAASARVDGLGAGEHVLVVSAPGRRSYHGHFTVARGERLEVGVDLGPERHGATWVRASHADPDYLVDPYTRP